MICLKPSKPAAPANFEASKCVLKSKLQIFEIINYFLQLYGEESECNDERNWTYFGWKHLPLYRIPGDSWCFQVICFGRLWRVEKDFSWHWRWRWLSRQSGSNYMSENWTAMRWKVLKWDLQDFRRTLGQASCHGWRRLVHAGDLGRTLGRPWTHSGWNQISIGWRQHWNW